MKTTSAYTLTGRQRITHLDHGHSSFRVERHYGTWWVRVDDQLPPPWVKHWTERRGAEWGRRLTGGWLGCYSSMKEAKRAIRRYVRVLSA